MTIPYENLGASNLQFFEQYKKSFQQTLDSGWYVLGKNVSEFERNFAQYCGTSHCVGVGNGLDALILGLQVLDLNKGDEVLVPSNTYIASILAIVRAGLKPVLVAPDISSYNIDPSLLEQHIGPKTRAIMLVHLYGKMCDVENILPIAKKHGLKIIEDGAQSHGAKINGHQSGGVGDVAAHSFYPTKNLGALGDGGAVTTNNRVYAEKLIALRNYGSTVKYHNDYIGMNSRLDEVQAGFLNCKLAVIDQLTKHKRKLAQLYLDNLTQNLVLPIVDEAYQDVYHIFSVRSKERDQLRSYLASNGVGTEVHYPIAPSRQKAMSGILDDQHCPIADEIHQTTLSLPISYCHSEEQILEVIELINKF